MPTLLSPEGTRSWRCPPVLRVKSAVFAAAGAAVALIFFPLWFAVPVALLFAAWGLGMAVRAATVLLDQDAGLLVLRMGLITRRLRLTDIAAVLVDSTKVSIARSGGGEISLYAWRKSPLDGWLRVPSVPGDIGHAVASAVALARDSQARDSQARDAQARDAQARDAQARERESATGERAGSSGPPPVRTRTSARSRSALATALLGGTGLVALASAFLVRRSWPDPVMTALSVIGALALGIAGLFYLTFALWLLLPRRASAVAAGPDAPGPDDPAACTPADRAGAAGI